jgi:import inner membrane translocase subunit TIM21
MMIGREIMMLTKASASSVAPTTMVRRGLMTTTCSTTTCSTTTCSSSGLPMSMMMTRRCRASSSSSSSASKKNQNQKRSGDEVQATDASRSGRYDEVTDKWIPEKPVSAVEGASYGVVGLIGLGIAAGAAWFAANELLTTPREQRVFNAAMEKLNEDPRVTVAVGTPMTGYGSESRSRGARRNIPHRVVLDARGRERLLVQFHVRGPRGSAMVTAEAGLNAETGEWDFQYIIADVQGAHGRRIPVIAPQAAPQRLQAL